jgi:hypothetical protein
MDYKEFVAGYGPGVVGAFLHVLHPQSAGLDMFETIERMALLYQELVPDEIPHPLFPAEGGMVQWASTVEGDACFLVRGAGGTWRIGVWFEQLSICVDGWREALSSPRLSPKMPNGPRHRCRGPFVCVVSGTW